MVWQDLIFRVVEKAGGDGARLGGTGSLCLAGAHLQASPHSGFKAPGSTPYPQLHVSSLQGDGSMHPYGRQFIASQWCNVLGVYSFHIIDLEHDVPALTLGLWGKATAFPESFPKHTRHTPGDPRGTHRPTPPLPPLLHSSRACGHPHGACAIFQGDLRNLILEHFHLRWLGFFSFLLLLLPGVSL